MSWTTVSGKKQKNKADMKPVQPNMTTSQDIRNEEKHPLTIEEIYKKNMEKSNLNKHISTKVIDMLIKETENHSPQEMINIFGEITANVIEYMSSAMATAASRANQIKNNQKAVLALTSFSEAITETCQRVTTATNAFEAKIDELNTVRKDRMNDIKLFLEKCGMETSNYQSNSTISPDIQTDNRKTYASAIGATRSDLVVDRPPVHTTKQELVDVGIASFNVWTVNKITDCPNFTIAYVRPLNVFMMRIGTTVCTLGPGSFINLKPTQGRTVQAKRCRNNACVYKECNYYHDPVTTSNYSQTRNFALSHVTNVIGMVKNDDDILQNSHIRRTEKDKAEFVRDLAQIGGMLLLRAAKIMALPVISN